MGAEQMDNAKQMATKTFQTVKDTVQEKIPIIKEKVQEQIPIVQQTFTNTINACKAPFISQEDRAEIYALQNDDNNLDTPEDTNPQLAVPENIPSQPIDPNLSEGEAYLKHLYDLCEKNGPVPPYNDFNKNQWVKYYPSDDRFFLWDKGKVIPNQTRVTYPDFLAKMEIYEGDINPTTKLKHGDGLLTTPYYVRIGQWRNGKFTGWGRECRRNGEVIEGKFMNGKPNGIGIFINSQENKYFGNFVNGKRHGKGHLITQKIEYHGDFKNNQMDGSGKIHFKKEGHIYNGEFRNNEISGKGKFHWQNGDTYEGTMLKGKMNGYGVYRYANGQIYSGNYRNGIKQGYGKITFPDGKGYEGNFIKGVPEGQGNLFNSAINGGNPIPVELVGGKPAVRLSYYQ